MLALLLFIAVSMTLSPPGDVGPANPWALVIVAAIVVVGAYVVMQFTAEADEDAADSRGRDAPS